MDVNIEDLQQNLNFMSTQLRVMAQQHQSVVTDFQKQHGAIVAQLGEAIQAKEAENAMLKAQVAAQAVELEKYLPVAPVAAAPTEEVALAD